MISNMAPAFRSLYKVVDDCEIFADVYAPAASKFPHQCRPVALIIHGGAFCLGHSAMVSMDQVQDMLERGWIVVSPEHRLCPQVDILSGPITDARYCLQWVLDGSLDKELGKLAVSSKFTVDHDRVVAIGTSSGGTLALALGFGVEQKVAAILDFYGATNFSDDFWSNPLPNEVAPNCSEEMIREVYAEKPVPTCSGVSLEGQSPGAGSSSQKSRVAFTLMNIANGTLMNVCSPSKEFEKIDACLNIDINFPPTCIIHGTEDTKVTIGQSRALYGKLQKAGVKCKFVEVPGEEHTFIGKMKRGSKTWDLQRTGFDWLQNQIDKAKD